MLADPRISVLSRDPDRKHRINANSFQQNALTTLNGWQYAAFYASAAILNNQNSCYVNLARRKLSLSGAVDGEWDVLTFEDYEQTMDDGHNTISIGICKGDGTIHIAFDHHCDQLRSRISKRDVALNPDNTPWNTTLFSPVQNSLPAIAHNSLMTEVTYPRFVNVENDLLLTYRIGQAGSGSDILFVYKSLTHLYTYLGQHLTGVSNSPYINGMDFRLNRVHISWCYRNFVPFDASAGAHKLQAGPNGPENNFDLNYAYSDDCGCSWKSSDDITLAENGIKGASVKTIMPGAEGARVFEIPMRSGILNQETQAADWEGGFWALNRENSSGMQKWVAYYRDPKGHWRKMEIDTVSQPTETGSRASICISRGNTLYLILPGNGEDTSLSIMKGGKDGVFETIWREEKGYDGEPLVDAQRLEDSDVLSVFTRTDKKDDGTRDVVVLDFDVSEKGDCI